MGFFNVFNKKKSEYYLQNVVELNKEFPRTFQVPSKKNLDKLSTGVLVKLVFVMDKVISNGCRAERMWVKIKDISNGIYTGTLDNDPYYLKSIKSGDTITFKAENIASIYSGTPCFNEKLLAIITKKALENRQINWVVRTDDLNNEQDSGW